MLSVLIHGLAWGLVLFSVASSGTKRNENVTVALVEHAPAAPTPTRTVMPLAPRKIPAPRVQPKPESVPVFAKEATAPPAPTTVDAVPSSAPSAPPSPAEGVASAHQRYLQNLVQILDRAKNYPRASLLREEEGRVVLQISLLADGTLQDVRVVDPSPFESLNQAALDSVKKIAHFPAPPDAGNGVFAFRAPLVFHLDRH